MNTGWNIQPQPPLLPAGVVRSDGEIKVKVLRKQLDQLSFDDCLRLLQEHDHGLYQEITIYSMEQGPEHRDKLERKYLDTVWEHINGLYTGGVITAADLPKRGTLPTKSYDQDAGWDLYSADTVTVCPNQHVKISTGIAVELPPGYCAVVCDRSSMGGKGIGKLGGVMDHGYRDEWFVVLCNHGPTEHTIRTGDRIAQALILPVPRLTLLEVDALSPTERGTRGFGSSGT